MIFWLLKSAFWSIVLVPAALVVSRWIRSAELRHLLWGLVILRLVLCQPHSGDPSREVGTWVPSESGELPGFFGEDSRRDTDDIARWVELRVGQERMILWLDVALWIWVVGAVVVLSREAWAFRHVRALVRRASAADDGLIERIHAASRVVGVLPPVIRQSGEVGTPFVWGFRRPTLVLPVEGEEFVSDSVLRHELFHVRRRDSWWAALELVASALHWWNPILWFARSRLRLEAEIACDAGAISGQGLAGRVEYARSLVVAAERALPGSRGANAIIVTGRAAMGRRVDAILSDWSVVARRPIRWLSILVAALTLGLNGPNVDFEPNVREGAYLRGLGARSWKELLRTAESDVRLHPTDGAALRRLGIAQFRLGLLDDAEKTFQTQLSLGANPANAQYNLACVSSSRGDLDRSAMYLRAALEAGFDDVEAIHTDPDLVGLRADARFGQAVAGFDKFEKRPSDSR